MIDEMETSFRTKTSLKKYFKEEWWCDKWRESWLDITRNHMTQNGQFRTMTTNNHDENLNLKVADCIGGKRKKISTLVYEITGVKASKENSVAEVKSRKASLLDTHAAITITHNIGKKNQTPKDIRMRTNQARMHLICGDVMELDAEMEWFTVKDTSSREKRFRDNKGNLVTVTRQSSSVLEGLLKTVTPTNVELQDSQVFVDLKSMVCSCTDHLWRSSLRDACHHIKAAILFKEGNSGDASDDIISRETGKLLQDLRRQQLAKPREGRNILLCSSEEVVVEEIKRLYNEHGQKVWETLSMITQKNKLDQYRPHHLPKDNVGRPKVRTAKPRPANPFRRKKNLRGDGAITVQRPRMEHHPKYSVKRARNSARRTAQKLVCKARQQMVYQQLQSPGVAASTSTMPQASTYAAGTSTNDVYKRLEINSKLKQSTPYMVQQLKLQSPGLTRGQIMLKLTKIKTNLISLRGRRIVKKQKAPDFVTP